jgi:nogalonic acid methyl ester cyclase / aklanonic acid methyl ester cyclase
MLHQERNNAETVRHVFQALNTGDISNVSDFISPRYFNHELQMDPVRSKMRGPQEFIDTVINLRNAISDLQYEEQESIGSGDKVVSIVTVKGNHTGSFFGFIPPTGNKITYQAVHVFTLGDDGKIVEHRAIRDDLALMYQLGVVSGTGPQYDKFLQETKSSTG